MTEHDAPQPPDRPGRPGRPDGPGRFPGPGEPDDRLRTHLRAADPAGSLAPADPATVRRLSRSATSVPVRAGTPVAPRWGRLAVAAAAVVTVVAGAGAGIWALAGPDDDGAQVALDPAPSPPASGPTVVPSPAAPSSVAPAAPSAGSTAPGPGAGTMTVLRVPGAVAARCSVPSADLLRGQDLAFEGTVQGFEGADAVLEVAEVYAGEVSDLVRVQPPPAEIATLLAGVRFEVGRTYLVSATGGQVSLCGLSAEAGPALAALYAEAYGG